MDTPDDARIGGLIGDPARRALWRGTVAALHEAAQPGGPLEGWLFHGTCEKHARAIAEEGVTTTYAVARMDYETGDDDWAETEGTHWGIPKVAAFYAEDLIESKDDPNLDLAIVAVRIDDLMECGDFCADGQTVDCPLYTRLGRTEAETDALWNASLKDSEACLAVHGTLLVLGPVPAGDIRILRSAADVEELAREMAAAPAP